MKLPPMALTAPTLCPRCDAPAIMTDHCMQCALQLRHCGACQGVAGPFDRFCGFCGHELILGGRRSPLWRLWLLLALVPIAAGLAYGIWSVRTHPVLGGLTGGASVPSPGLGRTQQLRSQVLGFTYSLPEDWSAIDYGRASDPAKAMPFVVATRSGGDQAKAVDSKGDLVLVKPQGAVVALGRPAVDASLVDPADPKEILTSQVAPLVSNPPQGVKVEVAKPVRGLTVNGRPAAAVVLRVTRDGSVYYLERAFVFAPQTGASAMFRAEALVPQADWDGGDSARVEAIIQSLKFI